MFQKTVQWFVDRLVERFLPPIGSFMGAALQRMLILGHAEHHDQLEEQARRYEAAGKPHLAALIREQSQSLTLDDPLPNAPDVMQHVTSALPEGTSLPAIGLQKLDDDRRRRRKKDKGPTRGKASQDSIEGDTE
jgi:hypothetical protein